MSKIKFNFNFNKKFALVWCVILAFTMAFFFTGNSPFFRYDTWADSSVYSQVGHSWLTHGMVPYKGIFDHKGPLHFFLFGLGTLLRVGNLFIGVYIIESILLSITLYFYFKTINLFIKSISVSILVVTLSLLVMFATVNIRLDGLATMRQVLLFEKGGSPEEFCLPFISVIVHFAAKFSRESILALSKKEWITFGLACTAIFLEKFTLSVPFILLFGAALVWSFFKEKEQFKLAIKYGLTSMLIPLVLTVVYFKLNGALGDFVTYYFKVNIFNYSAGEHTTFIQKLLNSTLLGIEMLTTNYVLFFGFLLGIFGIIFTNKQSKTGKLLFIYLFISVYVISIIPNRFYAHYLLPVVPIVFVGFGLIIPSMIEEKIKKSLFLKLVCSFVIIVLISMNSANEVMSYSRINLQNNTTSMEEVANKIKSQKNFSEDKTKLLILFSNNVMLHTLTKTTPITRFFYRPSMEISSYYTSILDQMKSKNPDYIVGYGPFIDSTNDVKNKHTFNIIFNDVRNTKLEKQFRKAYKNYKLIDKVVDFNFFDKKVTYLFKRK